MAPVSSTSEPSHSQNTIFAFRCLFWTLGHTVFLCDSFIVNLLISILFVAKWKCFTTIPLPNLMHLKAMCKLRKVRELPTVLWNMPRRVLPKSKIKFCIKFNRLMHQSEFHLRAADESLLSVTQLMAMSPAPQLSQSCHNYRSRNCQNWLIGSKWTFWSIWQPLKIRSIGLTSEITYW